MLDKLTPKKVIINKNLKETKINIISKAYKTDEKTRASNSLPYIRSDANLRRSQAKISITNTRPYQQDDNEPEIINGSKTDPSVLKSSKIPGQIL